MKILYSAFACDPQKGSEAQCGWAWAESMSKYHEIHVITREENRESIEKYINENKLNISVHFCDVPKFINTYNTYGKWYFLYYLMWQRVAYIVTKKLNKKIKFDVIHHVSLGDLRVIGSMWRIKTKFVFGPVGGGQLAPKVFSQYLTEHNKDEKKRKLITNIFIHNPLYKHAINKAYKVYAANKETQQVLIKIMKQPERCELLTENGICNSYISNIVPRHENKTNSIVTLLWAGRIVYRKGLEFLLDTLQCLKTQKKWQLLIVGDGPEKSKLVDKAKHMNNGENIRFIDKVSYNEMKKIYSISDVFVFPSYRETTGSVIFEAMINQLPVISFNQNGVSIIVDERCGILVPLEEDIMYVKNTFCNAIKVLIENDKMRVQMGKNAKNKIINNYLWDEKVKNINYN